MERGIASNVTRLLSSLQFRLIVGFALVLSAALLSVSLYVSADSNRQAERSEALRLEVRAERARLFLEQFFADRRGWTDVQPAVEELGKLLGARVLLRDGEGGLMADSLRRFEDPVRRPRGGLTALSIRLSTGEGTPIGYMDLLPVRPFPGDIRTEPVDSELASRVSDALLWAGLVAGGLGILAIGYLSRRALSPVRALSAAVGRLGRGDLGQRVSSTSEDEIGRLGESFNRMASDLEKAERQRRALLADVAHELRTPLSNIGGYVEAMCDGLVEANAENLGIVRQQVAQLTRLVEDLRLLTQAESGALKLHVQPGSANELLEQVAESFRPRAFAKGITLRCEIAETIPPVHMDHVRIRQVLYNLVENAVTHTPEGGMITLAAAMYSENRIRVSVTDTGPGVGPEDLETIFERLHRLDPSRSRVTGGAGLGLTIARRIMETHGGRIWAESKPGRGSSFLFELPLSPSIVPGSSAQHERHEPQG